MKFVLGRLVEKVLCLDGWSIPLATGITVVIATLAPRRMAAFRRAGEAAGVLCMQVNCIKYWILLGFMVPMHY